MYPYAFSKFLYYYFSCPKKESLYLQEKQFSYFQIVEYDFLFFQSSPKLGANRAYAGM